MSDENNSFLLFLKGWPLAAVVKSKWGRFRREMCWKKRTFEKN